MPKHPQHLAWEALYPHFGERADFIVSLIAHLLPEGQPGLAEAGETSGGWVEANRETSVSSEQITTKKGS